MSSKSSFFSTQGTTSTLQNTFALSIQSALDAQLASENARDYAEQANITNALHVSDAQKYSSWPAYGTFTTSSVGGSLTGQYSALHWRTLANWEASSAITSINGIVSNGTTSLGTVITDGDTALDLVISNGTTSLGTVITNGDTALDLVISNGTTSLNSIVTSGTSSINTSISNFSATLDTALVTGNADIIWLLS